MSTFIAQIGGVTVKYDDDETHPISIDVEPTSEGLSLTRYEAVALGHLLVILSGVEKKYDPSVT